MADPEPLEVGEEEAEEDADESPLFVASAVREGLPVKEEVEDPVEEAVGEAVEVRALEAVEERALEALAEDVLIRVASAETVLDDNEEAEEEPVGADEPVLVTVREDVDVEERVAEIVQERSMVEPSAQSATQPQGEHVTLDDAPSAGENLPAGQGVGFTEERGQ